MKLVDIEDQIQGASSAKEVYDSQKDQTLQEMTAIVQQIELEIKERKKDLAPEINKLRGLRQQMTEVEQDYNDRKKEYDQMSESLDQEKEKLDSDVRTNFNDYRKDERTYHYNNIQSEIYDAFLKRINNE